MLPPRLDAPQDDQLALERLTEDGGTEGDERGQCHGSRGAGVVKLDDVQVVVVVGADEHRVTASENAVRTWTLGPAEAL